MTETRNGRKRSLGDPLLFGIVLLSLLLNVIEITWGLPTLRAHGWDVDSIAPTGPLAAAAGGFTRLRESFYPAYPLFHYMVSALCYAPYLFLVLITGGISLPPQPNYPYGLHDPQTTLNVLIVISRLISAVMATAIVAAWYRIACLIFDRTSALITAFLTATGFTFLYYAHTGNLDIPYLFWTSLALVELVRIQKRQGKRPYLWFGVFSALAIATKDQAYGYFVFPFLYVLFLRWTDIRSAQRRDVWNDPGTRDFLGGFLIAFVFANNLLLNPRYFLRHLHNVLFVSKYGSVSENFLTQRFHLLSQIYSALIHAYGIDFIGIPLVYLGAISLFRWYRQMAILLLPVCSYFLTFLLLVGYSFDRFVLGIVFVMNVAIGHTVSRWLGRDHRLRIGLAAIAATLLLISAIHLPRLLAHDSRYSVQRYLYQSVRADDEIWIYSIGDVFAPNIPANYKNVHYRSYSDLPSETLRSAVPSTADVAVLMYMFPPASGVENRQLLADLLQQDSGFSLVYNAKTRYFFDPGTLPFVNPQIYVFRRLTSRTTVAPRSPT